MSTIACAALANGQTRYVDDNASAGGNGQSWATAYRYVQDALADAAGEPTVTEIRAAGGVYRPDRSDQGVVVPGDRSATFMLRNGLSLRGGYRGLAGGGSPDDRDAVVFVSLLSGDLNGDDQPNWANSGENSYHVVTANAALPTMVLDGFTIRGGNAWQSSGGNSAGAGMVILGGSPTLLNCTFDRNLSHLGAGLLAYAGSATLTDCSFTGNYAYIGRGGGMYNVSGATPTLRRCRFIGNMSYGASSVGDGGAMFNELNSNVTLIDCEFRDNSSSATQSIYSNGGAICNLGDGMTVINTRFYRNSALVGGAVWTGRATTFVNCAFSGNNGVQVGGALVNFLNNAWVINCVFSRNATADGGAIENGTNAHAYVTNCVLWGNTSPGQPTYKAQIHNTGGSATVTWSCVQGVFEAIPGEDPPDPADFPGCIDANPLFVDADGADNVPGSLDDDFHLQPASPCIDAGNNAALPTDTPDLDGDGNVGEPIPIDLDGGARRADDPARPDTGQGSPPIVDMGVFERRIIVAGDIDADGDVDDADRVLFVAVLLGQDSDPQHVARADFTGDSLADGDDVRPFLAALFDG
ncbi:MAG: right-handed parallel beta-helix repeat-containing protein [Phycisphaerae bacterium]|nr:right-handed parallel beta-helix repeat-containing protein [Phycisphaerae bacterium]NUQ45760.1 right-handed parallel beta-helix repeat-containing protein [Phycisphaerae bacterium]